MNLKTLVLGAVIALMSALSVQASDLKTIAAATFKLYDASGEGFCSSTFLKNDDGGALFLTAYHCVDGKVDNKTGYFENPIYLHKDKLDPRDLKTVLSSEHFAIKRVKGLEKDDIAILQLMDKDVKFAEIGPDIASIEEANTLVIGDDLIAVGFPAAQTKSITKGTFAAKVPNPFKGLESVMYQTTVPIAGGNSGGALYAKFGDQWKLIGTTTGMRTDNSVMTWFQTAETVHKAVRGYGLGIKVTEAPKPENLPTNTGWTPEEK